MARSCHYTSHPQERGLHRNAGFFSTPIRNSYLVSELKDHPHGAVDDHVD